MYPGFAGEPPPLKKRGLLSKDREFPPEVCLENFRIAEMERKEEKGVWEREKPPGICLGRLGLLAWSGGMKEGMGGGKPSYGS